ncbi:hypothetical protein TU62_16750 [Bacillus cereus]|nr:hypothetical protein TU62_16750 [Bacillus cereus]
MKSEHAITLDKPLISLEEIIKIFQWNEVTQPIRERNSSIFCDTEDYIADKMTALHIDHDEYYSPFRTRKPLAFRHGMKVRLDKECY